MTTVGAGTGRAPTGSKLLIAALTTAVAGVELS